MSFTDGIMIKSTPFAYTFKKKPYVYLGCDKNGNITNFKMEGEAEAAEAEAKMEAEADLLELEEKKIDIEEKKNSKLYQYWMKVNNSQDPLDRQIAIRLFPSVLKLFFS